MDPYAQLAFTPAVKAEQEKNGSRRSYARMESYDSGNDTLGPDETAFIQARDGFYLASVSETGWPYVQFRGGHPGFLRVLDPQTIAFADFRGNRQYISVGAWQNNDRVALILMDYPTQSRLKILGRVKIVEKSQDPALFQQLHNPQDPSVIERLAVIHIEAFNWNCPQHITPRWSAAELQPMLAPLHQQIAELQAENARLRAESKAK